MKTWRSFFGFTLIELLIVASIMAVLFLVGVASYNRFNRAQILEQAALGLKSSLRLAQSKALVGDKASCASALEGYRFTIAANNYSFCAKCGASCVSLVTASFPSGVTATILPSPNPFLFKVLGQGTDISSQTQIILTGFSGTKTIIVSNAGEIR